ncbi:MAG: tetratricopeptide repeat protein [Sphingomonadales bacterium]
MLKRVTLESFLKSSIMSCIIFICVGSFSDDLVAQTGSHAGATTSPLTSFWFRSPDEIKAIRELLKEGKHQDAVDMSNQFIQMLQNSREDDDVKLYFGYNALCAAHTSNNSPQDAVEACSKAVSIFPGKWQAYNNRGTAYYTNGDFQKASDDYKQALAFGLKIENIKNLIQHNIDLVKLQIPQG